MKSNSSECFGVLAIAGFCLLLGSVASAAPVGKVEICHKPGNHNQKILKINPATVSDHEAHGDYLVETEVCDGLDQDCEKPPVADNDVDCSDGIACTVDSCAGSSGCFNLPEDSLCDDQNPNTLDECSIIEGGCVNTPIQVCGNGTVEPPEECDDGNNDDGDGCSAVCEIETPPSDLTVFVTSGSYTGNLVNEANTLTGYSGSDGLEAGDAICSHLADDANLDGTYRAWLSSSAATDPESTFTQGTVPYVLTDGTPIASDWSGLIVANLMAPVNRDENQSLVSFDHVWTATSPDGTSDHINGTCGSWTSAAGTTRVGRNDLTDSRWTQWVARNCVDLSKLYCVQQ